MKLSWSRGRPAAALVTLVAGLWLMPSMAVAQQKYIIDPIAEMKVKALPAGELFWRVESFPTLDAAAVGADAFDGVHFVLAQLETPLDGVIAAARLARASRRS